MPAHSVPPATQPTSTSLPPCGAVNEDARDAGVTGAVSHTGREATKRRVFPRGVCPACNRKGLGNWFRDETGRSYRQCTYCNHCDYAAARGCGG